MVELQMSVDISLQKKWPRDRAVTGSLVVVLGRGLLVELQGKTAVSNMKREAEAHETGQ